MNSVGWFMTGALLGWLGLAGVHWWEGPLSVERAAVLQSLYAEGFTHSQDGKQILAAAPKFEWFFFPSDTWECGAAENDSQIGYGCKVKIESGEGDGKKDTAHESE